MVNSLGCATCGPHTFRLPGEDVTGAPPAYRGSFGHEVPGTEHRIVDPETGIDLPEGEEGEVLVRGYDLMLGLYRCERAETFDSDGWYHTGDRGYFRDGWFFFTGRQTDLIKTGGSNVAPAEVEDCLMSYSDVKLAFVVGIPDEVGGQEVVALVVPWNQDTVPGAHRARRAGSQRETACGTFDIQDPKACPCDLRRSCALVSQPKGRSEGLGHLGSRCAYDSRRTIFVSSAAATGQQKSGPMDPL